MCHVPMGWKHALTTAAVPVPLLQSVANGVCGLLIQALNTSKVNVLKQVCLPGHDLAGLSLLLLNLPNMLSLPDPHTF